MSLPKAPTALTVEKLRDVYEHWDEDRPPHGTPFPQVLRWWSRKRSGKFLGEQLHPKAWPQSFGGTAAELENVASALRLRDLRDDLQRALQAVTYWKEEHHAALWEAEHGAE